MIPTTRPKSGKTTYHRDGTVTLWDCIQQSWVCGSRPSAELFATFSESQRTQVMAHLRTPVTFAGRVDLSRQHQGQPTTYEAVMVADGRWSRTGKFISESWHVELSWSGAEKGASTSPNYDDIDGAEAWLESEGLDLGGAYWHTASERAS